MPNHPPRRVILIWVPEYTLHALLANWKLLLEPGHGGIISLPAMDAARLLDGTRFVIPRDAFVERASHSFERRAFGLILAHDSFAVVPDGERPPEVMLSEVTVHSIPASQVGPDTPIFVETPQLVPRLQA